MDLLTLQSMEKLPKVAGGYEIISPKTMEETLKAQKNLLQITKEKTNFISDFKPYKQKVDEFKKQLLDYENEQVQKAEYYEKIQEGEIKKFKTEILLAQRFVQDEKAFIEWALVHARDLLKIEIVKSKFNALSEEQKKQIPGVVGREEV